MVVYVASCVDKDVVVVRIVLFIVATADVIFVVVYALLVMMMFVL